MAECHANCDKLARVEMIWVMGTDSTVDSALWAWMVVFSKSVVLTLRR